METKIKAFFSYVWSKIQSVYSTYILPALKSFWTKVTSDLGTLWQNDKSFLIIFGAIILSVKFRNILISLLALSSKLIFSSAKRTSDELQKKENDANDEANKLIQDSDNLGKKDSDSNIGDDWYKS